MRNFNLNIEGMQPISGLIDLTAGPPPPDPSPTDPGKPTIIFNRLCIVSKLETLYIDPRAIEVNAINYQDADVPVSTTKGHTIIVGRGWIEYLKRIQTPQAYALVMTPRHLWINRPYEGDGSNEDNKDPLPVAECIGCGWGNFLEIIGSIFSNGKLYYEIRALPNNARLEELTGPAYSWKSHPTLIGKETARRRKDQTIVNPGDGYDCYFPNIKYRPHLWVYSQDVELFPMLPEGITHYAVQGASVYGWTGNEYIPLRIAERPGQLEHPYPGWKLNTPSVIPPNN